MLLKSFNDGQTKSTANLLNKTFLPLGGMRKAMKLKLTGVKAHLMFSQKKLRMQISVLMKKHMIKEML